jgi:L-alanine-DL-glutamate epimerase-like enolase superfamily enzyme
LKRDGRTQNTSLVRLLGGMERPVPAYGAIGDDGVEDSARSAEDRAMRGFKGVKVKARSPTAGEDPGSGACNPQSCRRRSGDHGRIQPTADSGPAVQRPRALNNEGRHGSKNPFALVAREIRVSIQCGEN